MTLDGGESVLTCAGRVAKKWRGAGLYGRFKHKLFHHLRETQPSLKRVVMTVSNLVLHHEKLGPSLLAKYSVILERVSMFN